MQPSQFQELANGPLGGRRQRGEALAGLDGRGISDGPQDLDTTLLDTHSDKEQAAPSYKKGYGFHPLGAWLDNTGEALAAMLRPGNAGANTATDHAEVLDRALAQLPGTPRGIDPVNGVAVLARADSAGASPGFLDALRARGVEFSVGFDITEDVRLAILDLPSEA